jgi:phosphatidylinositol alpha-1,6-mannosyltransferase
LVTIGHGTEFTEKTSEKDFKRNKLAYGKSDLLIAISEHTKSVVLDAGIKPKKIEVIHNAANEKKFHKIDPELIKIFIEQKGLSGKKIILTCGSLSERKGQRVIINSLPIVLKEIPNVVYVAVGFPNKKDKFLQLAKELTINDKVFFPGIVDQNELLLWLNACDLFAMTSVNNNGDYEGFGIAVLEAALCGKTALVSDNGGLKEAVINLKTGIVVKENDVTGTANALIDLFSNDTKLQTLSDMAYKNTLEIGTYIIKGKEYDKVLAELIKK